MSRQKRNFYEFGPFRLDVVERQLLRGKEPLELMPKVYETLLALVEEAGHALEKDELLRRIWPDTFVEEGSLTRSISVLRNALGDKDGAFIETIPKHGYRFVAQVTHHTGPAESAVTDGQAVTPVNAAGAVKDRRILWLVLLGTMVLLLGAGLSVYAVSRRPAESLKSLAVLPLRSLDREAKDDHLELGMADTIIGKLSQIRSLTLRPMSAVTKFAGPEVDAMDAGRQLRVDAVLDGTLQRAGDRLRVRASLTRVRDGASMWSETFDVKFSDIFSVQDEVARQVASRLRSNLTSAEQSQLVKSTTANPAAYEYYISGLRHFDERGLTKMEPAGISEGN
jgi:DNA-binding winged helix-turn-helix (wHTH) protein/TolB-like protein